MKIKVRSFAECSPRFNSSTSHSLMSFTTGSPVDDFYKETHVDPDGKPVVSYNNPLQMLMNQERLNSMGSMGVEQIRQWLIGSSNPSVDKLRSQCSDEDLISIVKSKHLQSPAEILAWSKHMSVNMDSFKQEIAKVAAELQQDPNIVQPKSE